MNDHAIPFGHWAFLRVLWERDGLTQRQLSEEVGVVEPTTFAAVKAMAQEVNEIAVQDVSAADLATTKRVLLSIIANLAEGERARE